MKNWFEKMKSEGTIVAQAAQQQPAPNPSGSPGSPGAGATAVQPAAPAAAGTANAQSPAAVPPNSPQDQAAAQNKAGQAPAQAKIKGEDELFKAYPAIKTVVDWISNAKNVANHIQPAEGYLKNTLAELKNKGVIDDVLWKQITERKPGQ